LNLVGRAGHGDAEVVRPVRGGTMVWSGVPEGSGRLTGEVAVAIGAESGVLVTATPAAPAVFQEGVLDVAVDVEFSTGGPGAAVGLTGVGLPESMGNATTTVPAGKTKGWLSFAFPATQPPGPYTFAVRAQTEVATPDGKKASVTTFSNPITVQVKPARMVISIDPQMPTKIARGKIIQLRYQVDRKHGFIGKIHTELFAPGGVVGLRGRGVTFVGQTETGVIQVIATEDAPLGRQPFLRLEAVGTVEDQPVYRAGRFFELEITK
jgi:hypothetical protein